MLFSIVRQSRFRVLPVPFPPLIFNGGRVCRAKKEGSFSFVRGWQPGMGMPPLEHTVLRGILSERKDRTKLGLSKFTAEAAEQAAVHRDKLGIAGKVKGVASVHKTLWPEENQREPILNLAILTGQIQPRRIRPDETDEDRH
jgi:hypothetical protein